MLVGCQVTTITELTRMLADLPGIGVVRLTEQDASLATAQQVQAAGAKSIVLCNNYGSLASQVRSALALPGVIYAEVGNEPYWEGVSITAFATEVYNLLVGLSATDRARVAVACMEDTPFRPSALLAAEPRLRDVVRVLACHPYDFYGTGPLGSAGPGGAALKSGGRRYADTHYSWQKSTGAGVDIICTEFGWCTAPYVPSATPPHALPLVTEQQQHDFIAAAFADLAAQGYVKAATLYHYDGYDKPGTSLNVHVTPPFNGVTHWDYSRKPGWQALADAIKVAQPTPPVPPAPPAFVPAIGERTLSPDGAGIIFAIPDSTHIVIALDAGAVVNHPTTVLKAA